MLKLVSKIDKESVVSC